MSGPHTLLARLFRDAVAAAWGKPLTMNVAMPIAAVLLDLGFPPATVKAIPILARTAGLLAHLAEEREQPVGFLMAGQAEEAVAYERQADGGRVMLEPEVETRPWAEQLAIDDASYREQLAYLFERSAVLPREARARRASRAPRRPAGSADIARAAAHREARAARRRARPRTRSARTSAPTPAEIVRIYSTSGTTGTPSYIPLTAGDLDNWVTGSARSYAASGVARRPAHRLDLQRRPVRRGRGARLVRPHRRSATSRSAPATPSG